MCEKMSPTLDGCIYAQDDAMRAAMRFAAEYRGRFYALASAAKLAAFLLRPGEALLSPPLPCPLPRKLLPSALLATPLTDGQLALDGYCPIALARGPPGAGFKDRVERLKLGDQQAASVGAGSECRGRHSCVCTRVSTLPCSILAAPGVPPFCLCAVHLLRAVDRRVRGSAFLLRRCGE